MSNINLNINEYLVGGLEPWNFMTFHSVGNRIIIPIDFHSIIFQRGWAQPPARYRRISDYQYQSKSWNLLCWPLCFLVIAFSNVGGFTLNFQPAEFPTA